MKGKILSVLLVMVFAVTISSCSKPNNGGSSPKPSPGPSPEVNHQPVLSLSNDSITVTIDDTVVLDASKSSDPDKDDTLYFQWTDVDGLFASQNIDLTKPRIQGKAGKLGTFHFKIEVSDGMGGAVTGEVVVNVKRYYTTAQYSFAVSAEQNSNNFSDVNYIVDDDDSLDISISVKDPDIAKFGDKDECTLLMYSLGTTSVYSKTITFETNNTLSQNNGIYLPSIFGNTEGTYNILLKCKEPSETGYNTYVTGQSFFRFKLNGNGEPQAIFVSSGLNYPTSDTTTCYNESTTDESAYGTPLYPYHCITNAVERAKIEVQRKKIYIASGFYNEQINAIYPFENASNPSVIKGGFDTLWDYNENIRPVLYYNPASTIPADDYGTPKFTTYTLGFIGDKQMWMRVENLVILPSKPNTEGFARAILFDSGETYNSSSDTPNGEVTDIYFNNCVIAPYFVTSEAVDKVTFIEGLQAERIWFNRMLFTDYNELYSISGMFTPIAINKLNVIISNDSGIAPDSQPYQHFHNIGISNSISYLGYSNQITDAVFANFSTSTYVNGYQWFLFNTIYQQTSNSAIFYSSPAIFKIGGTFEGGLHVIGNLIYSKGSNSSFIFNYPFSYDYFGTYIWEGVQNNSNSSGSCMFNIFYRDSGNTVALLKNNIDNNSTFFYSLESFDKKVNEDANWNKAESRYNFSLNIDGQYSGTLTSTVLYSNPVTTFPGVDAAYIPDVNDLHLGDSPYSWGGSEPYGYFTYNEVTSKDVFGNKRSVNIPTVFYYNFDELDTDYRGSGLNQPNYATYQYQDIFRRNTNSDLQGLVFLPVNDDKIQTDIGAIEIQTGE